MQDEQHGQQPQAAQSRAEDVGAVKPGNVCAEARVGDAQCRGGAEEGNEQQQVDRRQPEELLRVPGDLEGIEGDPLGGGEAPHGGHGEGRRCQAEAVGIGRQQPAARQGDEGTGRTDAEQRDADGEVGEVVPLDDGEQPQQQHLVAQRGGRERGDGGERRSLIHGNRAFSRGHRSAGQNGPVPSAGWSRCHRQVSPPASAAGSGRGPRWESPCVRRA